MKHSVLITPCPSALITPCPSALTTNFAVIPHRKFKIQFKSESDPDLNWEFTPINDELIVNAGETALTFYKAYNMEEKPIIGTFAKYIK